MNKLSAWLQIATTLAFLAAGAGRLTAAAAETRPNVLLIVADDLGYNDVGFQGCHDIPTPNLDKLAASGVRCTNGYVSYSVCSPSRAGFLTGRYQQRFGHEFNPKWDPTSTTFGLPLSETTIADELRGAGYTTGIVGKWHQGAHPQFHPNRRGFDEFFGFLGGGHRYFSFPWMQTQVEVAAGQKGAPVDAEHASPMMRNDVEEPEEGELTTRLGTEATAFVSRHARGAKPWFLYLAFNAPHTPLQARGDMLQRFLDIKDERRRTYAAMVATVDEAVGRVLAAVESAGQRERTLVFFFSDNGGPMTKRNANASINTPLRGQKGDVFEGGIRIPFVVSWPGRLPAGVYDHPVISLDVLPTALAAAGGKRDPKLPALDGVDLLPYLSGKNLAAPHARLFWRMDGGEAFAVREGRWKWLRTYTNPPQLYDLSIDAAESRDVSAQHRAVAQRLAVAAAEWNRELVAPVWVNNPFGGLINRTGPP